LPVAITDRQVPANATVLTASTFLTENRRFGYGFFKKKRSFAFTITPAQTEHCNAGKPKMNISGRAAPGT
jgi:hypothetical protein